MAKRGKDLGVTHEKSVLYLGIDPHGYSTNKPIAHLPLVEAIPRPLHSTEMKYLFSDIRLYTHILFTCKTSVRIFFKYLRELALTDAMEYKTIIAIGRMATYALRRRNIEPNVQSEDESERGVIAALSKLDLLDAYVLLPRSSNPRPALVHELVEKGIKHQIVQLYDIEKKTHVYLPELTNIDEIVFTTPQAVEVFFTTGGKIPSSIQVVAAGALAQEALVQKGISFKNI